MFSLGYSCFEVPVPVENSPKACHRLSGKSPPKVDLSDLPGISEELCWENHDSHGLHMITAVFFDSISQFFLASMIHQHFLCPSCHLPTSLICRKLAPDGAENKDAKPSCMRSRVTLENALLKTNSEHYWKLPSVSFPGASRVKPFII